MGLLEVTTQLCAQCKAGTANVTDEKHLLGYVSNSGVLLPALKCPGSVAAATDTTLEKFLLSVRLHMFSKHIRGRESLAA